MSEPEAAGKYIVYACPAGPLAEQIDIFFSESRSRFGPNKAHEYPPHVTLTGFFNDLPDSLPGYAAALSAALGAKPEGAIAVSGLLTEATFYGLGIVSPWLESLTADFAARAPSSTRLTPLRLKGAGHGHPLHLSLAYGFRPGDGPALGELARGLVVPSAAVVWRLCLYELRDGAWVLHASYPV